MKAVRDRGGKNTIPVNHIGTRAGGGRLSGGIADPAGDVPTKSGPYQWPDLPRRVTTKRSKLSGDFSPAPRDLSSADLMLESESHTSATAASCTADTSSGDVMSPANDENECTPAKRARIAADLSTDSHVCDHSIVSDSELEIVGLATAVAEKFVPDVPGIEPQPLSSVDAAGGCSVDIDKFQAGNNFDEGASVVTSTGRDIETGPADCDLLVESRAVKAAEETLVSDCDSTELLSSDVLPEAATTVQDQVPSVCDSENSDQQSSVVNKDIATELCSDRPASPDYLTSLIEKLQNEVKRKSTAAAASPTWSMGQTAKGNVADSGCQSVLPLLERRDTMKEEQDSRLLQEITRRKQSARMSLQESLMRAAQHVSETAVPWQSTRVMPQLKPYDMGKPEVQLRKTNGQTGTGSSETQKTEHAAAIPVLVPASVKQEPKDPETGNAELAAYGHSVNLGDEHKSQNDTGKDILVGKPVKKENEELMGLCFNAASNETQNSVFASDKVDRYLSQVLGDRASADEPAAEVSSSGTDMEMDDIDGFPFYSFRSIASLEKHMRQNRSLATGEESAPKFGVRSKSHRKGHSESSGKKSSSTQSSEEVLGELVRQGLVRQMPSELVSGLKLVPEQSSTQHGSSAAAYDVHHRGVASGDDEHHPRLGRIYGRRFGRFASKACISYHTKKFSLDSGKQHDKESGTGSGRSLAKKLKTVRSDRLDLSIVSDFTAKRAIMALTLAPSMMNSPIKCTKPGCRPVCSCRSGPSDQPYPYDSSSPVRRPPVAVAPGVTCLELSCRLGCVCDSIGRSEAAASSGAKQRDHCGRPECMIQCACNCRTRLRSRRMSLFDPETVDPDVLPVPVTADNSVLLQKDRTLLDADDRARKEKRKNQQMTDQLYIPSHPDNANERATVRKSGRIRDRPSLTALEKSMNSLIYYDPSLWLKEDSGTSRRNKKSHSSTSVATDSYESRHHGVSKKPVSRSDTLIKQEIIDIEDDSDDDWVTGLRKDFQESAMSLVTSCARTCVYVAKHRRTPTAKPAGSSSENKTIPAPDVCLPLKKPVPIRPIANIISKPVASNQPLPTNIKPFHTQMVLFEKNAPKGALATPGKAAYLLEIQSNCAWDKIRTKILSKISAECASTEDYPKVETVFIDGFRVSILPKADRPVSLPEFPKTSMALRSLYAIRIRITQSFEYLPALNTVRPLRPYTSALLPMPMPRATLPATTVAFPATPVTLPATPVTLPAHLSTATAPRSVVAVGLSSFRNFKFGSKLGERPSGPLHSCTITPRNLSLVRPGTFRPFGGHNPYVDEDKVREMADMARQIAVTAKPDQQALEPGADKMDTAKPGLADPSQHGKQLVDPKSKSDVSAPGGNCNEIPITDGGVELNERRSISVTATHSEEISRKLALTKSDAEMQGMLHSEEFGASSEMFSDVEADIGQNSEISTTAENEAVSQRSSSPSVGLSTVVGDPLCSPVGVTQSAVPHEKSQVDDVAVEISSVESSPCRGSDSSELPANPSDPQLPARPMPSTATVRPNILSVAVPQQRVLGKAVGISPTATMGEVVRSSPPVKVITGTAVPPGAEVSPLTLGQKVIMGKAVSPGAVVSPAALGQASNAPTPVRLVSICTSTGTKLVPVCMGPDGKRTIALQRPGTYMLLKRVEKSAVTGAGQNAQDKQPTDGLSGTNAVEKAKHVLIVGKKTDPANVSELERLLVSGTKQRAKSGDGCTAGDGKCTASGHAEKSCQTEVKDDDVVIVSSDVESDPANVSELERLLVSGTKQRVKSGDSCTAADGKLAASGHAEKSCQTEMKDDDVVVVSSDVESSVPSPAAFSNLIGETNIDKSSGIRTGGCKADRIDNLKVVESASDSGSIIDVDSSPVRFSAHCDRSCDEVDHSLSSATAEHEEVLDVSTDVDIMSCDFDLGGQDHAVKLRAELGIVAPPSDESQNQPEARSCTRKRKRRHVDRTIEFTEDPMSNDDRASGSKGSSPTPSGGSGEVASKIAKERDRRSEISWRFHCLRKALTRSGLVCETLNLARHSKQTILDLAMNIMRQAVIKRDQMSLAKKDSKKRRKDLMRHVKFLLENTPDLPTDFKARVQEALEDMRHHSAAELESRVLSEETTVDASVSSVNIAENSCSQGRAVAGSSTPQSHDLQSAGTAHERPGGMKRKLHPMPEKRKKIKAARVSPTVHDEVTGKAIVDISARGNELLSSGSTTPGHVASATDQLNSVTTVETLANCENIINSISTADGPTVCDSADELHEKQTDTNEDPVTVKLEPENRETSPDSKTGKSASVGPSGRVVLSNKLLEMLTNRTLLSRPRLPVRPSAPLLTVVSPPRPSVKMLGPLRIRFKNVLPPAANVAKDSAAEVIKSIPLEKGDGCRVTDKSGAVEQCNSSHVAMETGTAASESALPTDPLPNPL